MMTKLPLWVKRFRWKIKASMCCWLSSRNSGDLQVMDLCDGLLVPSKPNPRGVMSKIPSRRSVQAFALLIARFQAPRAG
jgi:hypothetical protein